MAIVTSPRKFKAKINVKTKRGTIRKQTNERKETRKRENIREMGSANVETRK